MNQLGGIDPKNADEMARAKEADLITLPKDVSGANCGNCKWFASGICKHPKVAQQVTPRQCCSLWDRAGSIRPWILNTLQGLSKILKK